MLRKETAFTRCRAMDRRWNRKTVNFRWCPGWWLWCVCQSPGL